MAKPKKSKTKEKKSREAEPGNSFEAWAWESGSDSDSFKETRQKKSSKAQSLPSAKAEGPAFATGTRVRRLGGSVRTPTCLLGADDLRGLWRPCGACGQDYSDYSSYSRTPTPRPRRRRDAATRFSAALAFFRQLFHVLRRKRRRRRRRPSPSSLRSPEKLQGRAEGPM